MRQYSASVFEVKLLFGTRSIQNDIIFKKYNMYLLYYQSNLSSILGWLMAFLKSTKMTLFVPLLCNGYR
jgi:hypothetical protein